MAELWDGRNRDGSLSGVTLVRGAAIPAGQYHMVCETLIRHADGEILLMQRDPRKEAYPGYWEAGAGGSALQGEDADACIRREVREETGIGRGTFTELGRFVRDETQSIFVSYVCVTDWDKTAVALQEGETVAFRWVSEAQFRDFLRSDKVIDTQLVRYRDYYREMGWME